MCAREKLTDLYLSVFRDDLNADQAWADDAGQVFAEFDGLVVVAHNHAPRDPQLLHVWTSFPTDIEQERLSAICNAVSLRSMVASLLALPDQGIACVVQMPAADEGCLPERAFLSGILPVVVRMIRQALERFATEVTLAGIAEATDLAEKTS